MDLKVSKGNHLFMSDSPNGICRRHISVSASNSPFGSYIHLSSTSTIPNISRNFHSVVPSKQLTTMGSSKVNSSGGSGGSDHQINILYDVRFSPPGQPSSDGHCRTPYVQCSTPNRSSNAERIRSEFEKKLNEANKVSQDSSEGRNPFPDLSEFMHSVENSLASNEAEAKKERQTGKTASKLTKSGSRFSKVKVENKWGMPTQ